MSAIENDMAMSTFAKDCLSDLKVLAKERSQQIVGLEFCEGETENFISLRLSPSEAKIWIYEDGAEIQLGPRDGRFEWQDFNGDLGALRVAFIQETHRRLKESSVKNS